MIEMDVQGLDEFAKTLENLGDKLGDKVLAKALNAGARPIKKMPKLVLSLPKSRIL